MVKPSAARQRVVDTAFRLFYAHGIRAVGVDRIIAESGVAKATFYKHFPSKDALVVAYLDTVDGVWTQQLHDAADAAGPAPADQLVGMFDALSTACRRDGYRGCAFINAAAENEAGTPVHDRTLAHKNAVRVWVRLPHAPARWRVGQRFARRTSRRSGRSQSGRACSGDSRGRRVSRQRSAAA
jgi:AcrR family transcriptional regulator